MSADDNDDTADVPRVGPTFSTLPLGPLENAVMFLREGDVGQLLRTDKDMHFSAVDSDEFWRERCCHMFGRHLHCIEVRLCWAQVCRAHTYVVRGPIGICTWSGVNVARPP